MSWPQPLPVMEKLGQTIVANSAGAFGSYEVMYGELNLTSPSPRIVEAMTFLRDQPDLRRDPLAEHVVCLNRTGDLGGGEGGEAGKSGGGGKEERRRGKKEKREGREEGKKKEEGADQFFGLSSVPPIANVKTFVHEVKQVDLETLYSCYLLLIRRPYEGMTHWKGTRYLSIAS